MSIGADELFDLAAKSELSAARLYEAFAEHIGPGDPDARLFKDLACQEHEHARWAREMRMRVQGDVLFENLEAEDFRTVQRNVEQARERIATEKHLAPSTAIELMIQIEHALAEDFYLLFPAEIPGVPSDAVQRMVRACQAHLQLIETLSARYKEDG